jgi:hypothetical protein
MIREQRGYLLIAIAIVGAALCFDVLTLRPGHNWDGDYALYVMQARNLADGTPYADTNYIANPDNAIHPALYPPGLPLLLAPVYKVFGLDLDVMKGVGIAAFAAWLFVFALIARRFLPAGIALAATGLMGVHPYFWELKDTIYAAFPFLLFTYAALLCAQTSTEEQVSRSTRRWMLLGVVIFVAFAYSTRTVAIVLFPVIAAATLYRTRSILSAPLGALLIAAGLIAAISAWLPSDTGTYLAYFDQFSLREIARAGIDYALATGQLVQTGVLGPPILQRAALFVFLILVAVGFIAKLRESVTMYEVFTAAYGALLLIYPVRFETERYSLPLWPLLLLYALKGAVVLGEITLAPARRRYAPIAVAAALLGLYGVAYAGKDFSPIANPATGPIADQMYDAVRRLTTPDSILLSRKPTIIGLFTERKSATWPRNFIEDDEFWSYAAAIEARYLIQDLNHFGDGDFDPNDRLDEFVAANSASLNPVFQNEWFNVFEIARR